MSFSGLFFEFDGKKSTEFPIYVVRINSGMFENPIGGSKQMNYDKVPYNDDIYYYNTELETMKFSIVISPLDKIWTEDLKYQLFGWLGSRQPKPFRTSEFTDKLCYCICTNALNITMNHLKQGYVELEFEATTPYWLSDKIEINYDLTNINIPFTFNIDAVFNVRDPKSNQFYYYPILEFELVNNSTSFTIQNLSDGGRITSFTGLSQQEYLRINNKLQQIESSTGQYRLKNFNKNWFRLVRGRNVLKVSEKCKFKITCQYPIYI